MVEGIFHELKKEIGEMNGAGNVGTPLNRLDPNTVMVDFIRWLTKKSRRVEADYRLGKDKGDGDNEDYGHYTFNLETGDFNEDLSEDPYDDFQDDLATEERFF